MPAPAITTVEAELAYAAAQKVVETHRRVAKFIRVGMTLAQIDAEVAKVLALLGCRSCFLHYRLRGLPAFPSHACLSLNECIVHGTAGFVTRPLVEGDLLKLDIGVEYRGMIGDAAWTYSVGTPKPEVERLMESGKVALAEGVKELKPGNTYLNWARRVQEIVEMPPGKGGFGFHCVRGLGGHGYGLKKLHKPPYVSNTVPNYIGEWPEATEKCRPGTLLAVEPMIALGTGETRTPRKNDWPVNTADGSLSVHYEHDVLITEEGPRVLSAGMEELPDVVG
ncbi:type I methionyl aminopeptidase [soil metagenome]